MTVHFTLACLSGEGWRYLIRVNQMWEKAEVKGQGKPKASDIVQHGKPLLRCWQVKELCGFENKDVALLLKKVTLIRIILVL